MRAMAGGRRAARSRAQRGAQIVEASLIFLLLLGIFWLLIDTAWVIFIKATLQHAVREGCRYAITSRTDAIHGLGHVASIKEVVQYHSMGLISDEDMDKIHVRFYEPGTLQEVNDNRGGMLVVVSIENYELRPLVALLKSGDPVQISVRAGDRMEASPSGIPPPL